MAVQRCELFQLSFPRVVSTIASLNYNVRPSWAPIHYSMHTSLASINYTKHTLTLTSRLQYALASMNNNTDKWLMLVVRAELTHRDPHSIDAQISQSQNALPISQHSNPDFL